MTCINVKIFGKRGDNTLLISVSNSEAKVSSIGESRAEMRRPAHTNFDARGLNSEPLPMVLIRSF